MLLYCIYQNMTKFATLFEYKNLNRFIIVVGDSKACRNDSKKHPPPTKSSVRDIMSHVATLSGPPHAYYLANLIPDIFFYYYKGITILTQRRSIHSQ